MFVQKLIIIALFMCTTGIHFKVKVKGEKILFLKCWQEGVNILFHGYLDLCSIKKKIFFSLGTWHCGAYVNARCLFLSLKSPPPSPSSLVWRFMWQFSWLILSWLLCTVSKKKKWKKDTISIFITVTSNLKGNLFSCTKIIEMQKKFQQCGAMSHFQQVSISHIISPFHIFPLYLLERIESVLCGN